MNHADTTPAAPPAHDHPGGATNPAPSDIANLITHLLGTDSVMQADTALAQFDEERLAAIQQGAERQAEACLQGLQSMSHVLGVAASHPQAELPNHVLFALAEHLHSQSLALECWIELAGNAAYLRINPGDAGDPGRRDASPSGHAGDWPDPG